ncbi:hypothetical protein OF83DRAFT_1164375 [Amylostereum chailletii]|nr:hypothetical protein OF83DRAFT_1164375 [Amylostereum chailletii]
MASLGKRKERDEVSETYGSTIFVSNLPYTATSTDLQTLFSDIAPVRTAFVVCEPGTGVSKGVGYVSFAIREDAQSAMEDIEKKGMALNGRNLRVSWAKSKLTREKEGADKPIRSTEHQEKRPRLKTQTPAMPSDPLAVRTVIVSGLPTGIDSKTLWKKFRKQNGAKEVEWPAPLAGGGEDPATANILFTTPAKASEAVSKLHAHVFKGALLSVTLKKRLEIVAKAPRPGKSSSTPTSTSAPSTNAGPTPSRASRLIVRNLPFDITEQDLRALFLPYGIIHSIHIPLAPVPDPVPKDEDGDVKMEDEEKKAVPQPRGKGFAFVWMWTKKEAEKAMEGCNGVKVRAGFAEGLVKDKQKRKKAKREEKKAKEKADGGAGDEDDDEKEEGERVIAVDWALSKDKWEVEKQRMVDAEEEEDTSESQSSDEEDESSALGLHEGDEDDSDEHSEDDDDDRSDIEERTKPQLPPPETGTTLFIRNIPFEATEDELRTLFRSFGPLRYARITMDHATGRSRGTGFACFWNKSDADKAVEQSDILRADTIGSAETPKKNPFTMPSILTPDPSALSAQSLVLHGRTLDVVRAVTRDEAGRLKDEGEKAREKADKRNMYLLREGVILPNTPAAQNLPLVELEKRSNSFNARRTLLKSNPSLYVSKTRLSIRQIPLFVSEGMIRRLALHAVRAFEEDVKAGRRAPLTADELAVPEEVQEDGVKKAMSQKDKDKDKKKGRVKQAKIIRQQSRVDARTGLGRSRGYGFLEMRTHADSLRVLRWANNNPKVGTMWGLWEKEVAEADRKAKAKKGETEKDDKKDKLKKAEGDEVERKADPSKGALIVEFSIENVQVVQRRATKERVARTKKDEGDSKRPREKLALPKREQSVEAGPERKKRRVQVKEEGAEEEAKGEQGKGKDGRGGLGALIGRKRREKKGKSAR